MVSALRGGRKCLHVEEDIQVARGCGVADQYLETCTRFLHDICAIKYFRDPARMPFYAQELDILRASQREREAQRALGCKPAAKR
jgi:hypothetical protein